MEKIDPADEKPGVGTFVFAGLWASTIWVPLAMIVGVDFRWGFIAGFLTAMPFLPNWRVERR